ncbi:MAG: dTDP-4-dehydrorhamnose 3,5-epimerase [Bdellovibrionales bacterium]|nr:dTDP-4-dehydrorhamnose 3,5-epimerase [Bdellovibrionales bacterium]
MEVVQTHLNGVCLIIPRCFLDLRGFFTERFRVDLWQQHFPEHGGFIQDNYSWSKAKVLRGLHYQAEPVQGKLVTCVAGSILDVVVDLRKGSQTYGEYDAFSLSAEKPQWLWVPPGFAHGFFVTSDSGAGVAYKVDSLYNPKTEGSLRWNDPTLNIDWPDKNPILNEKDKLADLFLDYDKNPRFRT